MAINAAIVSEYWQPHENAREMWEYGGKFYTLGIYWQGPQQAGLGMFRTNDANLGEVDMSNGGVAWEEVDIAGSPRHAWSMAFGQDPYDMLYYVADRFGDVVYFTAQCLAFGTIAIQVGSFDLSTGTWNPQGTDDATNPNVSSGDLFITDMKVFDVDSYLILYFENSGTVETIKVVQYVAGTWGTPLTVQACDSTIYQSLFTFPRLAHEQSSDYAHLAWIQENGASGNPPPNDAIYDLMVCTYTISAGTVGTITTEDTFANGQHTTIGVFPIQLSYFHNFDGDSFLCYYWKFGTAATDFEYRYLQAVPSDSATPTWSTGLLSDTLYQYDNNNRFVTVSGTLRYVHTIGEDSTESAPYTNANPQIAYRSWDGANWDTSDTPFYVIATGFDWPGRTTNDVPVPDSLTWENYDPGGNPIGLHVIGVTSGLASSDWAMPVIASTTGGSAGFVCMVPCYWERLFDAWAVANYFFRAPSATPSSISNNVMYFGAI